MRFYGPMAPTHGPRLPRAPRAAQTIHERIDTAIAARTTGIDTFTFCGWITLRALDPNRQGNMAISEWHGTSWQKPHTHATVDAWITRALSEVPTRYLKEGV